MTELEFKTKLKELNEKLMASTTREEQAFADHQINCLVDSYSPKQPDASLAEANAITLLMAG